MEKKTEGFSGKLNKAQLQAVTEDPLRPCLVIAGPGSGKTAVIAARCRFLVEEANVPPSSVLVLTFTRAAASEMQERFRKETGGKYPDLTFGTFHSVFYRAVSRKYGLTTDNLVKEGEKQKILQELMRKYCPEAAADSMVMESLLSGFSKIRCGMEEKKMPEQKEMKLVRLYTNELRRLRKLDYDDILLLTREMLQTESGTRKALQEKYRYILVDEYQDVSPVQADICRLMAAPSNRIFAVGDDDQAIYRFRGASPDIMLRFGREFPGCSTVRLNVNYRSSPEIVKASLRLISHNKDRYQKSLQAASGEGKPVVIRHFSSEKEEYRRISEMLRNDLEEGRELSETAVLFRTNAAISAFSAALLFSGVPFVFRDKVQNPFHHYAADTLFSVINYALGDHRRANFLKFMNCPVRYFRRSDLPDETVELDNLKEFYRQDTSRSWMTEKVDMLSRELSLLLRISVPYAMVNYIRRGMGLDEYYAEAAKRRDAGASEIPEVLDFVQDSARGFRTVSEWYRFIAAFSKELLEKREDDDLKGRVVLSTIHRAKGLEYERIIITDVCEQNLPHTKAESEEELSEERRLFYVAMTRAKTELLVCVPRSIAGRRREESRFLNEIRGSGVLESDEKGTAL